MKSLQAQVFTDWTAEVHNDSPGDSGPAKLVAELCDPRITLIEHERNLGGSETFNLFFVPTQERFYSLLEDDNWWEPNFLERMVSQMNANPHVCVGWSNQHVAVENHDGTWTLTNKTVRPLESDTTPRLITWPQVEQLYGALHSNGAMLVRSRPGDDFRTPAVEFTGVEGFRERCFPHPMLYLPQPLAWFAITKETHRKNSRITWGMIQSLLVASFLANVPATQLSPELVWSFARNATPPTTSLLVLACLAHRKLRHNLRHTVASDWLKAVATTMRRPSVAWAILVAHRRHREWWQFLNSRTAERAAAQL